jgi:outer membrane protein assembly factor BamE (lipoprotein component of BamABCDE complex)
MNRIRTLLLLTTVAALAACSRLSQDNLDKIQNGMTTDQVEAILGAPTTSQTGGAFGISGTTFIYHTDKSDVKITFVNDKVIAKEGNFQ